MKVSAPHRGWTSGRATPSLRPNPYAAETANPAGRHLSFAEICPDDRGRLSASLYQPTYTNSSSVTITNAATLYVDNAPAAAGSATITHPWAISVGAGNVSFPGTGNALGTITSGTWNGTAINLSSYASGTLQAAQFPALTGDVTTSSGSLATTVEAIQGNTVSGTTGTDFVVFSASPTLTGTVTGAASNWSGNVGIGTTAPSNPLSVNGIIQSLTGGFKFPDGTTQTTASSGTSFGSWSTSYSVGTVYQPATDGILVVVASPNVNGRPIYIYSDGSNPPTTQRGIADFDEYAYTPTFTMTIPIRNGDYWEVTCVNSANVGPISWLPLQ